MKLDFSSFSLCLLIIFILFAILYKSQIGRKTGVFIFIFTLSLTFLAFLFDPVKGWNVNGNYTDLYRFFQDMDAFNTYGWNGQSIYFNTAYQNIPIVKVIVYLVAITGNYGLLPAFSAAIVYGGTGVVLIKANRKGELRCKYAALAFLIFFALTNYKVMITNIRMPIGMTVFFVLAYYDFIEERKNIPIFLGYISLCAIHSIFVLFIVFRLLMFLMDKYSKWFIYIMTAFSGLFLSLVTNILSRFSKAAYILSILYKIDFYTTGDKGIYYESPIIVLGIIKIALMLVLLREYKKKNNLDIIGLNKFYELSLIITVFSIGACWNYYLFMRITNFLCFLIAFWSYIFYVNYRPLFRSKRKESWLVFTYTELIIWCTVLIHLGYYFLSYQYRVLCF